MEKRGLLLFVVVLVLVVLLAVLYFPFVDRGLLLAPSVIFPQPCVQATVEGVWSSVFPINVSGLTIVMNGTGAGSGRCESYYAYKIENNITYILGGIHNSSSSNSNKTWLVAVYGNYSYDRVNETSLALSEAQVGTGVHMDTLVFGFINGSVESFTYPHNITSIENASDEFDLYFDVENSSEFSLTGSDYYTYNSYLNTTSEEVGESITETLDILSGGVHVDNQTGFFSQIQFINFYEVLPPPPSCTQNWVQMNASVGEDNEEFITWYEDSKNCGNFTGYPGNLTWYNDSDGDGFIGDIGDVDDDNLDVELFVDDDEVDFDDDEFDDEESVEFRDDDITRVEFEYDFGDEPLNLKIINIKIQGSSSDYGYILVQGLEDVEKTVRLDKLTDTNAVCIKDEDFGSIGSISNDCDDDDETYLDCPGDDDGFDCSLSSQDVLVVSGLDHSGVKEIEESSGGGNNGGDNGGNNGGSCTSNWNCYAWSACSSSQRSRLCADLNGCDLSNVTYTETELCTVDDGSSGCTTDWTCSDWSPDSCPNGEMQTRTCTDINSCGTNLGKPTESRSCERNRTLLFVIIGILVVLIIGTIVALVFILRKKNRRGQGLRPETFRPKPQAQRPGGQSSQRFRR